MTLTSVRVTITPIVPSILASSSIIVIVTTVTNFVINTYKIFGKFKSWHGNINLLTVLTLFIWKEERDSKGYPCNSRFI